MADDLTDREPADDTLASARAVVILPATLLIVVGAISLLTAITGLVQRDSMPAQIDQMIADIENNPKMTKEDKENWTDMLTLTKDALAQPSALIGYAINLAAAAVVILGGIKLLNLSGPALPSVGATVAMLPCTLSCCCALGLPVGLWAIVAMCRPDVRAAMARNSRPAEEYSPGPANRDELR